MVVVPYHHGDLRAALLDAAEAIATEKGAHGWSLREVAGRVGVSPSAAYHHFADRESLARELARCAVQRLLDEAREAVAQVADGDGGSARLEAFARAYVSWARAHPALFETAFGSARRYPGTPVVPEAYALLEAEVAAALGLGRTDEEAVLTVWTSVHGVAALAALGPLHGRSEAAVLDHAGRVVAVVVAGLQAAQALRGAP